MIKIQQIIIREFRGIRDFTFDMKGDNFAVCGQNGTGKSGIVDSIEFALTGNVSCLKGEGAGVLSVKKHGPHVDCKDDETASVTLNFKLKDGKEASIFRTVKNINNPTITPQDADVLEALEHIKAHPEFVLSRRELIKYVLSTPGDRAKEIQALLRLDKLESLRIKFQKIANNETRNKKSLESQKQTTGNALAQTLGIAKIDISDVLQQVNIRRKILGLPEIEKLEANTSLKDGLDTIEDKIAETRIPKVQALADIKSLEDKMGVLSKDNFITIHATSLKKISDLATEPLVDKAASHREMLDVALGIFDDEQCPVCETEWEASAFRAVVQTKRLRLETIKQQRDALKKSVSPIIEIFETLVAQITIVAGYGPLLPTPIDARILTDYKNTLDLIKTAIRKLFPLSDSQSVLEKPFKPTEEITALIENLKVAIMALPDPSSQNAARIYLSVAQERMEDYRTVNRQLVRCSERVAIADKIHKTYGDVKTAELQNMYANVAKTFRDFYRSINADDESTFDAKLKPTETRLDLDVDFYGRGYFPPAAYHSEGHQDSMGLCLYLALMQHLLLDEFSFTIWDDVLTSVDAGHRRAICTLLKQEFPNTQFILTTHDEIWFKHMKTERLIRDDRGLHFKTWSVNIGPTKWDNRDVWREIEDNLTQNNVREASALLRGYLEYFFKEVCHKLRAPVAFRGDAQYALGDLLPSGVKRLQKLLNDGIKSAKSWEQNDKKELIETLLQSVNDAERTSNVDQWQINTAIHYNEWENLNKADFEPVVEAFKKLTNIFKCDNCQGLIYLLPEHGKKETLCCRCDLININLKKGGANK